MNSKIKSKLKKILNCIAYDKGNTYCLIDYFEGIFSKEELKNHYSVFKMEKINYELDDEFINNFLKKIKNTIDEKIIYEILLFANDDFLYKVLKNKFLDKEKFYSNIKKNIMLI